MATGSFGIHGEFNDNEKQRVVSAAVETFCRYAPKNKRANFWRALLILVYHDAADAFARMHQIKSFVDLIKA